MRLLELFSGTGSVGRVAREELGYEEVVSLDVHGPATICCDVLAWDYCASYPVGYFDVIWASPPCETFSKARFKNIGRHGITRESLDARMHAEGIPLLRRAEEILDHFRPTYYFMENPDTGCMKDFVDRPSVVVDYCRYGFPYRKRTRIWTNREGIVGKLCDRQCGSFADGRHRETAIGGNGRQRGRGSGKDRRARHPLPAALVRELLPAA
jgi:hypothetical protein